MFLVRFSSNYADALSIYSFEFDVDGFALFTKDEWSKYLKRVEQVVFPNCLYFGTNEGLEFNSKNTYLSCFTIHTISHEDALFLVDIFNIEINPTKDSDDFWYSSFGICPFFDSDLEEYSEPSTLW